MLKDKKQRISKISEKDNKKKETIIVLSHVNYDNPHYCSFVHSHAKSLKKFDCNVIVLAVFGWKPKFLRNKNYNNYKGVKIIDGVTVKYIKRLSISSLFKNSSINFNGLFYYLAVKKTIKKLLKDQKINLIDAHTYKIEGYAAYRLKRKFNIKTFVTLHGTDFETSFNNKNGRKEIVKLSKTIDYYICVSDKIKKQLLELKIKNAHVIWNGIDFYDVIRDNNNYNIVTIGSFTEDKNIDLVIEAFNVIKQKFPKSKLKIIGRGKLEDSLKQKVNQLKLKDVYFMGFLDHKDVYNHLSKSSVFALTSKPEGFGIVYVEAMYCGCLPIGTIGQGIDGFIKNHSNGFLVNPIKEELVKAIEFIFENDCSEIRKKARLSVDKLTWEANAKKYLELV